MPARYFEDFEIGESFTTRRRTVTEADIVNFAGFSGDFNPIHMDETFARTTPFGRRIAHGMAVLSIATGLSQALGIFEGTLIAFLGLEWNFLKPVFIGDTIYGVQKIASKRETSKPDRGIVILEAEVLNQNGEVVQKGKRTVMMQRKPTA
jgi:acyl dehydratase